MSDKPTALRLTGEAVTIQRCRGCNSRDLLIEALEGRITYHNAQRQQYQEAAATLESERAANAALTSEVEALRDENKVLEASCEAKADRIDRLGESVERDTALLRQALEALKSVQDHRPNDETNSAITALRKRLGDKG